MDSESHCGTEADSWEHISADKERMTKHKKSVTVFGYPLSIFFIVVSEFCERFSYYGIRAVLVLYFKYFLRWDDNFATTIYHTFLALCYLTPILGAIIADSWLGKFKTIIYLSIVYAAGQIVMAVSAIHDITDANRDGTPDNLTFHVALGMVGLALIALGAGAIKPCVAAFGGDQFQDQQEKQRSTFFSIFYLSINAATLLSTVIMPILRAQECGSSRQKCFPLAFGVPAALMVVALIVFIIGSRMYIKNDPQGNIFFKVCKCIGFAIKNRLRNRGMQKAHWMDWAEDKYDKLLIAQVKMVLKVLFLYIPLPMFWALFEQQGSRWTLQATNMNGNFGFMTVLPDQMQTVNPILILVLVPIMDALIYPLIAKCKLNFTPLKRMTVGMFLAALAFVAAAVVQIEIDKTSRKFPSSVQSQVKFINMNNQIMNITAGTQSFSLPPFTATEHYRTFDSQFELTLGPNNTHVGVTPIGTRNTSVIIQDGARPRPIWFGDLMSKPEQGANAVRFFNGFSSGLNVTVGDLDYGHIITNNMSEYRLVSNGNAHFTIKNDAGDECMLAQTFGFGSSYTLVILPTFTFGQDCASNIKPVMDIEPNTFHMAWQIPQYFLITSGEAVFSVTGLEFSYAQAPSNMKSVLQAGWLLAVTVGNIIVLIVTEAATLPDQRAEFILFASLLVVVCVIFAIMAYFYTYIDPAKIEAQFADKDPKEEEKKKSLEMEEDSFAHRRDSDSDEEFGQTKI